MKSRFILFAAAAAILAPEGFAAPRRAVWPAGHFEYPSVPIAFPMPTIGQASLMVGPAKSDPAGGFCGGVTGTIFHCPCDFGFVAAPRRETRLPDPVAVIGAAYLQSRSVRGTLLDPQVHVDTYPEGHFGSWVQDGVLVTDRIEITSETALREVFGLLVEAIGDSEEDSDCWVGELPSGTSPGDYRRSGRFVPEMSFEFVGDVPLRVELNLRQERLLIQAGDKWEVRVLDRWSGAALRRLLAAPRPL
jgi:hypothetical protein